MKLNVADILSQVEHDLFDFDAAADVEENTSDKPDYVDVEGAGTGFGLSIQRETDGVLTEEGWRGNVDAKLTYADAKFEAVANRIKANEASLLQIRNMLSVICDHLGMKQGSF